MHSLPQALRAPIEKLRDVQKQCDSIKTQYLKELKDLEAKYKSCYGVNHSRGCVLTSICALDRVYDTRARLIQGGAVSGLQSGEPILESRVRVPFSSRILA